MVLYGLVSLVLVVVWSSQLVQVGVVWFSEFGSDWYCMVQSVWSCLALYCSVSLVMVSTVWFSQFGPV